MSEPFPAVAIIDPFSSGALFGCEARRLGLRPYAVFSGPDLPEHSLRSFRRYDFEDAHSHTDLDTTVAWLRARGVRAVVPGTQTALGLVDVVADRLGVPGNCPATAAARADKGQMKQRLRAKDVACAASTESDRLADLLRWTEQIGYPVVTKPPRGFGTKGVRVCKDRAELEAGFDYIMNLPPLYHGGRPRVLVEEYLDGEEYFINFLHRGDERQLLCVARYEKIRTTLSAGVYRNIWSLPLAAPEAHAAADYVCEVNRALAVRIGINDIEFKLTSRGPRVIELNNRLPGAFVPDLIHRCSGFDCYAENLRVFLGLAPAARGPVRYHRHFCVCCLISDAAGTVTGIEGMSVVRNLSSFVGVHFNVRVGDSIEPTTDLQSTWGLVFLVHEDPDVLRENAEIVHRALRVTTGRQDPSARP